MFYQATSFTDCEDRASSPGLSRTAHTKTIPEWVREV